MTKIFCILCSLCSCSEDLKKSFQKYLPIWKFAVRNYVNKLIVNENVKCIHKKHGSIYYLIVQLEAPHVDREIAQRIYHQMRIAVELFFKISGGECVLTGCPLNSDVNNLLRIAIPSTNLNIESTQIPTYSISGTAAVPNIQVQQNVFKNNVQNQENIPLFINTIPQSTPKIQVRRDIFRNLINNYNSGSISMGTTNENSNQNEISNSLRMFSEINADINNKEKPSNYTDAESIRGRLSTTTSPDNSEDINNNISVNNSNGPRSISQSSVIKIEEEELKAEVDEIKESSVESISTPQQSGLNNNGINLQIDSREGLAQEVINEACNPLNVTFNAFPEIYNNDDEISKTHENSENISLSQCSVIDIGSKEFEAEVAKLIQNSDSSSDSEESSIISLLDEDDDILNNLQLDAEIKKVVKQEVKEEVEVNIEGRSTEDSSATSDILDNLQLDCENKKVIKEEVKEEVEVNIEGVSTEDSSATSETSIINLLDEDDDILKNIDCDLDDERSVKLEIGLNNNGINSQIDSREGLAQQACNPLNVTFNTFHEIYNKDDGISKTHEISENFSLSQCSVIDTGSKDFEAEVAKVIQNSDSSSDSEESSIISLLDQEYDILDNLRLDTENKKVVKEEVEVNIEGRSTEDSPVSSETSIINLLDEDDDILKNIDCDFDDERSVKVEIKAEVEKIEERESTNETSLLCLLDEDPDIVDNFQYDFEDKKDVKLLIQDDVHERSNFKSIENASTSPKLQDTSIIYLLDEDADVVDNLDYDSDNIVKQEVQTEAVDKENNTTIRKRASPVSLSGIQKKIKSGTEQENTPILSPWNKNL